MENEETKQASAANIQVFQGNAITDARYEMSVIEKQLVYMLLSLIKKDERTQGLLSYRIHIKDIEKHSPKTITNYNVIRDATKKLVGRVYEINQKDSLQRSVLLQTTLLSSAKYVEGSGMVEMTISQEIRPYLMDLAKGFTVYSLNCALSLKSIYSQRIYELLSRFKDLGSWRVKISDLRYILKLEGKYDGYGMFKQKVIDVAKKELAEKTDITFTVEEIKRGKKIEEFVFIINRRADSSELRLEFNEDEKLYNRLISEFKLAPWQAKHYLQTIDRPTIHKTLFAIKMAVQNGKVANIGAYSAQVFINLTLGKGIDEK